MSSGVADAIEYLNVDGVILSYCNVKIIRYIDSLFDIFNSRTLFAKGFKSVTNVENFMGLN